MKQNRGGSTKSNSKGRQGTRNDNKKPSRDGRSPPRHGNRNNNRSRNKKVDFSSFYEEWYDNERINEGIAKGEIYTGVLRISAKSRLEGYVSSPNVSCDIYIDGEKGRNRALNGDVVAVELLPQSEWTERSTSSTVDQVSEAFTNMKFEDNVGLWQPLVEENSPAAAKQNQPKDQGKPSGFLDTGSTQARGKVVGVLAANEGAGVNLRRESARKQIGVLLPHYGYDRERPNKLVPGKPLPSSDKIVEFRPLDSRVPFMHVPRQEVPFEFTSDPFAFAPPNQRLVEVSIASWDPKHRFPRGRFIRTVGEAGEIGPETEALLIENNCDHGEFPDAALEALAEVVPENGENWVIPEEEIRQRKDLRRSKRIFTIDPATAKDLDDALHCVLIPAGKVKGRNGAPLPAHFEIGVHIADVSYFLEPDTALDREAQRRSTTVYLVNQVIPMLPSILCEELCSLNEGVDRLAYSCIWRMTEDGDMLENSPPPWFGRTVIRSCCRLDYGLAQKMMDGTIDEHSVDTGKKDDPTSWPDSRLPEPPHTKAQVIQDVVNLGKIAMNRRVKRFDKSKGGALQLTATKMSFTRDEKGNPIDVCAYPIRNSNRTIEEYMLMANYLVAQQLILAARNLAFIRHHPPPDPKGMAALVRTLETNGIPFDPKALASAAGLHETLEHLKDTQPEEMMSIIHNLLRKPMKPAAYHTAGSLKQYDWRHWALNIPYYTHFTSPIRRYADVEVHRLLTCVLSGPIEDFPQTEETLEKIAKHCNEKKEAAKMASQASDKLFLCVLVKSRFNDNNPIETVALVQELGPNSFTILLADFGVDCRVHAEKEWEGKRITAEFREDVEVGQHQKDAGVCQDDENDDEATGDSKKNSMSKSGQVKEVVKLCMDVRSFRGEGKEVDQTIELKVLTELKVILVPTLTASVRIGFKTRFQQFVR